MKKMFSDYRGVTPLASLLLIAWGYLPAPAKCRASGKVYCYKTTRTPTKALSKGNKPVKVNDLYVLTTLCRSEGTTDIYNGKMWWQLMTA